ncbi:hypothetical protein KUL72_28105 [Bradyrhizobium arachidis]|uniref:hypothetical protein n=1 Tax=Bradyrhizobium TaxID=374 RepID=UPI002163E7F2|nr:MULTISPECIES: hypothetical protein [Bradyrhizobium]MDN4988024.1 hypothetical protein [Bradyrhizobium sp. WYCCWR 13022]UVO35287.1 hypothetical protein KUL72_28105 [Bradyrhizobium arachidis]
MAKSTSSVLVFDRKRSPAIWMISAGSVALAVVAAISGSDVAGFSVVLWLLLACMFFSISSQRTTVHVDLDARRLRITRRYFGRWGKTIVDGPFDQCRAVGRIEYETDGHASYGVYVELLGGRRHDIPIKEKTVQEAGRVAARLSEATGIPRLDTKF